jgi:hypothetical protein
MKATWVEKGMKKMLKPQFNLQNCSRCLLRACNDPPFSPTKNSLPMQNVFYSLTKIKPQPNFVNNLLLQPKTAIFP